MDEMVKTRQRGVFTLPATLRDKYIIEAGGTFRIVDLEGIFVLRLMVPRVPEPAREIDRLGEAAGPSLDDLLSGLREERERYVSEHYPTRDDTVDDEIVE